MASQAAQLFSSTGLFRKRGERSRIGLHLTQGSVWLVAVVHDRGGLRVVAQAHEALDPERWADALPGFLQKKVPAGGSLHVSLAPSFYSLLLVDAPAVPESELREAARWRIRDLVSQPLDSLVVDVFALPEDAFRGRNNMIYAAATDKTLVRRLSALHSDRYPLLEVGVQELALVKTALRLPGVGRSGIALLSMEQSSGGIHLCENGQLYLSRAVDFSSRDAAADGAVIDGRVDRLALDVQRSLDYYESQIGKTPPGRLLWFGSEAIGEPFIQSLQSRVSVECVAADLEKIVNWPEPAAPEHQLCWASALGAALGGEEGNVLAAN